MTRPSDEAMAPLTGQAFDHLPCGIVIASTSAEGEILLVNAEFTAITGYAHADVPTVADWVQKAYPDPDYRAMVTGNWERDVSVPGRDVFYRVRCADGQDRELLLRAGLLGSERMIVTMVDLSQIRRVERELRESEERFQLIANNVDQVVWIHGIQPEVMEYVSPAFERIWGRPVDVLYADPMQWSASIVAGDRQGVQKLWAEALAGDRARVDFEYRIERPDGELRYIEDRGVAVRDEDGRVVRMVGIAKDVTARKKAEETERELVQRTLQAQKMESLGVLAGGVAHDFNNLLMGVLGNADLALAELPAGSPLREYLGDIELSARRAAELARQLLAYSGRGKFVVSRVDLRALTEEMAQLMQASISKKAGLRFEFAEARCEMEGDPSQIRQVVMNLITNAAEALGEASGTITVRTDVEVCAEPCMEDGLPGGALPAGRYCVLEVSDTGAGMDELTRLRVFDPFFSTKFTGRGLGLASVLGIVKGHGGAIRVDSEPGRGSTFRVLLPASSDRPEEVASQPRPAANSALVRGTILVVDDERPVRDVLRRMLSDAGCEVLEAADGSIAVSLFRERFQEIDAVILDLAMPIMDGLETHRALREIDPGVRVLLSSGYSEQAADVRFANEGLSGFLQKPYAAEELIAALGRLLG